MQNNTSKNRLLKEYKEIKQNPVENCNIIPNEDDIYYWNGVLFGPEDTPYEGGVFKINIMYPMNKIKKYTDFVISLTPYRISLGGGGFLNNKIRENVQSSGLSFWLNWHSATLVKRITKSKKRPLVFNLNENEIKKLILDRLKIYSLSNYKINCEKLTKNEIVNKIIYIYEKN